MKMNAGLTSSQDGPELVFGLVGPVGSDLGKLIKALKRELKNVDYSPVEIRLSKLLWDWRGNKALKDIKNNETKRINDHMKAGDRIRRETGMGDAMIRLAMGKIRDERANISGSADIPAARTAYILNSLKHPAEAETLRDIYGEAAIIISLYEPKHTRQKRLANAIAKSKMRNKSATDDKEAAKLVEKDET